jgi:hypothetical protein
MFVLILPLVLTRVSTPQLVENKESRYLEQLAVTFDQYGLSFDPAALYNPPAAGDEAAAVAAQQLLESQDIVAWVPKKKMMVSG